MARACSICGHPARHEIDRALIAGQSCRSIAAAHGLDHRAVDRHRVNHLPIAIRRAAREALEREEAAASAIRPADHENAAPLAAARPGPSLSISDTTSATTSPSTRTRRRGMQLSDTPSGLAASPGATVSPPPATSVASSSPITAPAGPLDLHEASLDLRRRALSILETAERDGDLKTALTAIREARGVLEHLSRLEERTGATGQAAPLAQAPEWHRTRAAIITALAPYPEARIAVAEALVSTGSVQ